MTCLAMSSDKRRRALLQVILGRELQTVVTCKGQSSGSLGT